MRLKEVKPPPSSFDYVKCVPIRNNHLRPIECNQVVIVNAVKESQPKPSPKPNAKAEKPVPTAGAKGSFSGHRDHFQAKGAGGERTGWSSGLPDSGRGSG